MTDDTPRSGTVVNLRVARKNKARAERAATAEANRRKYGRTKAEKRIEAADRASHARTLDNAQRSGDGPDDDA